MIRSPVSIAAIGSVMLLLNACTGKPAHEWSAAEVAIIQSLRLDALPELPPDPSNAVADNPLAAEFGRQLFFDIRLSGNGGISCATCHQAERRFTDGLQKGQAIGTAARNTPSIVGAAYSPWQYWDGRRDSLWAQALAPLEDVMEHGSNRTAVVAVLVSDADYAARYQSLFGDLPDLQDPRAVTVAFVNVGKAIAAFERTVLPTSSRFDEYAEAVSDGNERRKAEIFSEDEAAGLRLFIGEANCLQCHNGPLLTNHEFHNTGVISLPGEVPDLARISGVVEVMSNEFNCRSPYSDDPAQHCDELDFARSGIELLGAHKTPSLRNLENTAPYMHKGQLANIAQVLQHYNEAPDAMIGHNEAKPLNFSRRELGQLERFLASLAAPVSN